MKTYSKFIKIAALLILLVLFSAIMPISISSQKAAGITGRLYRLEHTNNIGSISVTLETVGKNIGTLAADTDNQLLLKARATDTNGRGVPDVTVSFEISELTPRTSSGVTEPAYGNGDDSQNPEPGTLLYNYGKTGPGGYFYNVYTPPADAGAKEVKVTAFIDGSEKTVRW